MKILAVGDLHGDSGLARKLAEKAKKENVDLVILTGDLTFLEQSTYQLIGPFEKEGKEVLIIPGNHESNATMNFLESKYAKTKNLHGTHSEKNGIGFFGVGYATTAGPFAIEEKEMMNLLKKGHEKIKHLEKRIMVTHMHPEGSSSEKTGFRGSSSIKKAIKEFKPDVALFSHIHEAGGVEDKIGKTRVINVSRKGTIFEI